MDREMVREGWNTEDMSLLQCGGRMNLCSVGNNWPWCFNSSMKNQMLQRTTKTIIICHSASSCVFTPEIKEKLNNQQQQQSFQLILSAG